VTTAVASAASSDAGTGRRRADADPGSEDFDGAAARGDAGQARAARWRLGVALIVSLAVHAGAIWRVHIVPPVASGAPATPLSATLVDAAAAAAADAAEPMFPPGPAALARRMRVVTATGIEAADATAATARQADATGTSPADRATLSPVTPSSGVPLPQIADPEYYPARQLDQYPRPVDGDIGLIYPAKAITAETSGTVKLLVMIDELGVVDEVHVVEADPPGWFEDAAIESFRRTLFVPGQRLGRAVKSRLVVEVRYDARTESARMR
jgi:protein TonB